MMRVECNVRDDIDEPCLTGLRVGCGTTSTSHGLTGVAHGVRDGIDEPWPNGVA
jgi:hypothetical protein